MSFRSICSVPSPISRVLLPILLIVVGGAVHAGPIEDAQSARDAGNLRRATIVLKDRLEQDPDDAAVRVLLSQVYLDGGDAQAALQEIERARRLEGVDLQSTLVPMVAALLATGKAAQVIERPEPGAEIPQPVRAELMALRGDAFLETEDFEAAGVAYGKALNLQSNHPRALRGEAKLAWRQGLVDQTKGRLTAAVEANPNDSETRLLAGDFAYMQGRYQDAQTEYSRALQGAHKRWLAHYKRALARTELGRYDEAAKDLEATKELMPGFVGQYFARGFLAFREGNYEAAANDLEMYLRAAPEDTTASYYSGAALFKLARYAQAEEIIERLVRRSPESVPAANLLAAVRLKAGNPRGAEEALARFAADEAAGAETLRLYAKALTALDLGEEARQVLARAQVAAPQDASNRLGLALAHLREGESGAANLELARLLREDPSNTDAHTLMVKSLIDQGDTRGALEAADAFARAHPDSAQARYVLGIARNLSDDQEGARAALTRALSLERGHPDASFALAGLEIAARQMDKARALYEAVLDAHPEHTDALLKLVQVEVASGNPAAAIRRLETAMAERPEDVRLRINLARGYQASGDSQRATRILQDAPAEVNSDPSILLLRAQLELAEGQAFSAAKTLETLVREQPGSDVGHYLLASALAAANNVSGARDQLAEAFRLAPDSPLAPEVLAEVYTAMPDAQTKRDLINHFKGLGAEMASVRLLEARLTLEEGRTKEGIKQLQTLRKSMPGDRQVLMVLLTAQYKAGDYFAATQTASSWVEKHQDDLQVARMLAQLYAKRGREAKAVEAYRALLEKQPADPVANNNLALLLLPSDPAQALPYAGKAREAAPDSPAIADTLGQALLATGDAAGAAAVLADAWAARPSDPTIAFHYANALAEAGDAAKARSVLLLVLDKSFPEKDQAQALLQQLTAR